MLGGLLRHVLLVGAVVRRSDDLGPVRDRPVPAGDLRGEGLVSETKGPETMLLPVRLTDEERRTRGEELGRLCAAIEDEEERNAALAKELREALKAREAERTLLARVVASGEEHRPVEVSL